MPRDIDAPDGAIPLSTAVRQHRRSTETDQQAYERIVRELKTGLGKSWARWGSPAAAFTMLPAGAWKYLSPCGTERDIAIEDGPEPRSRAYAIHVSLVRDPSEACSDWVYTDQAALRIAKKHFISLETAADAIAEAIFLSGQGKLDEGCQSILDLLKGVESSAESFSLADPPATIHEVDARVPTVSVRLADRTGNLFTGKIGRALDIDVFSSRIFPYAFDFLINIDDLYEWIQKEPTASIYGLQHVHPCRDVRQTSSKAPKDKKNKEKKNKTSRAADAFDSLPIEVQRALISRDRKAGFSIQTVCEQLKRERPDLADIALSGLVSSMGRHIRNLRKAVGFPET